MIEGPVYEAAEELTGPTSSGDLTQLDKHLDEIEKKLSKKTTFATTPSKVPFSTSSLEREEHRRSRLWWRLPVGALAGIVAVCAAVLPFVQEADGYFAAYLTKDVQPLIPLGLGLALRVLPTHDGLVIIARAAISGLVISGVAAPLSALGLHLIKRSRVLGGATLTAALAIALIAVPRYICGGSGNATVSANLLAAVLAWKTFSCAVNTPAPHQTHTLAMLLLYLGCPINVLPSADPNVPQPSQRTLRGALTRVADIALRSVGIVILLSLDLGVGSSSFSCIRLYAQVWLVYLSISSSTATMGLGLWWAGLEPRQAFRAPLLASESPFDMWSRRWNLCVRDLFHETIYTPARHLFPRRKWLASLLSFMASGLLHEIMITHTAALPAHRGKQLAYFASQLPLLLAWPFVVEKPLAKIFTPRLRPKVAWLLSNVALLPFAPLFVDSLIATGIFKDLALIMPRIVAI